MKAGNTVQAGVVERITSDIRRILAPNPSAMTGPGTNTYILGHGAGVIVVDPGPDDPSHIAAITAALGASDRVSAIVVTHAHKDHSDAARPLSALTSAPVLAFGDAASGRSAGMARLMASGLAGGGEGVDHDFRPDRRVADGEVLPCGAPGLRILHTPGHMGGHICAGFGDVLLSGDHAMGWATSLISPPDGDMAAYMASLDRLMAERWRLMLPGHGEGVPEVHARLQALSDHRRAREAGVLAALNSGPASPATLTRRLYHTTPAALLPAAQRNVLAHLIDLEQRNLVTCKDLPGPDTIFSRTA
ncbi:MAG: MBL fold metallo-hydrolase [Pseudotabrizicola sp.]|uniref:MBL fold metallo-hydrolase n=1 Tax=Pseudotabrizicola sp. TaxID=2939647 RepID=UPI00271EA72D|nr:MBL fold metallo-hydrolase [Pseudotabrizicola sp.]MDO9637346.1 MBL fold metallo-hydrolase [Pseudotabrizicola sp.]